MGKLLFLLRSSVILQEFSYIRNQQLHTRLDQFWVLTNYVPVEVIKRYPMVSMFSEP
jgi:hypothetical protein